MQDMLRPLPRSLYENDAAVVAKSLLGQFLVHRVGDRIISGRIVETEAYYGTKDPASRAYSGKKGKLNHWMWEGPGTIFGYIVHAKVMFNIITGKKEDPQAVLIRAVEPLSGLRTMRARRRNYDLTRGPGKMSQAMGLVVKYNGLNVSDRNSLVIVVKGSKDKFTIASSHRIGVTKDLPRKLRFYIKGSKFVSR